MFSGTTITLILCHRTCDLNLQIFAAANADGKLQIWDLTVSSIDPVVTIDTNLDDKETKPASAPAAVDPSDDGLGAASVPPTPAVLSRFDRYEVKEEAKDPPMVKLIKNLTNSKPKRELTSVQFGEKSPTIAVGDNNGSVLVYRIYDPVTITHEGPMQQTAKLRSAIVGQVDPTTVARLYALEEEKRAGHSGAGTD